MDYSLCNEILAARECGNVRCGVLNMCDASVASIAMQFGLRDNPTIYRPISVAKAFELIVAILHRDMAYNHEVMPEPRAAELARKFLDAFGQTASHLSNGYPSSWQPATDATFDTGIIVLSNPWCGCLWVEDED